MYTIKINNIYRNEPNLKTWKTVYKQKTPNSNRDI
jgi:hypothetical protein